MLRNAVGSKRSLTFYLMYFFITVLSFLNCFPLVRKIAFADIPLMAWVIGKLSNLPLTYYGSHQYVHQILACLLEYLLRKAQETRVDIPLSIISSTTQKATFLSAEQNKLVESSQKLVKWVCPGLWVRYRSPGLIEVMRLQSAVVIKILFLQPGCSTSATYVTAEK